MSEQQNTFVQIVATIVRCRRFLIGSFIFGAIICLLASHLQPKLYAAKISFLPVMAVEPNSETAISNTVVALSILSGKSNARSISVLKSRFIREEIIKKLELMKVYKTETMIEATEILAGLTKIETNEEGAISIEVSDRSPQRSADIANEYGNQLCNAQQQYQFVPLKVLDTPTPPVEPIRPRKSIVVVLTVVLTLFLDLIVLFSHKFVIDLKEQSPDEFEKLQFIQMTLKSDLQSMCFWRKNNKDARNENAYVSDRYLVSLRSAEMSEPAPNDRIDF